MYKVLFIYKYIIYTTVYKEVNKIEKKKYKKEKIFLPPITLKNFFIFFKNIFIFGVKTVDKCLKMLYNKGTINVNEIDKEIFASRKTKSPFGLHYRIALYLTRTLRRKANECEPD